MLRVGLLVALALATAPAHAFIAYVSNETSNTVSVVDTGNWTATKTRKGVRSRYDNIDLVVVRENTEDLYAGIEFAEGTPEEVPHPRTRSFTASLSQTI